MSIKNIEKYENIVDKVKSLDTKHFVFKTADIYEEEKGVYVDITFTNKSMLKILVKKKNKIVLEWDVKRIKKGMDNDLELIEKTIEDIHPKVKYKDYTLREVYPIQALAILMVMINSFLFPTILSDITYSQPNWLLSIVEPKNVPVFFSGMIGVIYAITLAVVFSYLGLRGFFRQFVFMSAVSCFMSVLFITNYDINFVIIYIIHTILLLSLLVYAMIRLNQVYKITKYFNLLNLK